MSVRHEANDSKIELQRRLLTELLRQSEQGLEYQEKTRAWQQMGCPEGGPDALEPASDDDADDEEKDSGVDLDDDSEKRLDPRAGRAHVVLSPLPVAARAVADMLAQYRAKATPRGVRRARITIQSYKTLAENEYPLKAEGVETATEEASTKARAAARSLYALEKNLIASSDELALRGLSRKHRKRLLAKTRAGLSIVEDPGLVSTKNNAAGDWQVEETKPVKKNKKQDDDNKENVKKKLNKRKLEQNSDTSPKKQKLETKQATILKDNTKTLKNKKNKKVKTVETQKVKVIEVENRENKSKNEITNKKSIKKISQGNGDAKKTVQKVTPKILNGNTSPKKQITPKVVSKKVKSFQKQLSPKVEKKIDKNVSIHSPKKVKFMLKNNSKQDTIDYYKSIRQSPSIPFDSSRQPSKTNLKPSTPSPINPFFKKKWKITN